MRTLGAILACAVALGPIAAAAQPVVGVEVARAEYASERPDSVAVVVYRDQPVDTADLMERSRRGWHTLDREGLALIIEKRTVDIPAGDGVVRFMGLGSGIVPHSAMLEGLPAELLEQNADYDLISTANLLGKSVGQSVRVVRTNPSSGEVVEETGILRAGQSGAVVQIGERFEALDCSGLTERLVFEAVPEGLGATPTLSVKTRAAEAGRHQVTLAYLATGLQWSADYVASLSRDGRSVDLKGWITLANFGNTSFADAPVVVVAGDLSRDADTQPIAVRNPYMPTRCWPQGRTDQVGALMPTYKEDRVAYNAPPAFVSMMQPAVDDIVVTASRIKAKLEALGDYKAYVLPHLTTVAARQTKQVLFLDQDQVPFERVLSFDLVDTGQVARPASVLFKLRNDEAQGLGLPVPGGKVVVMTPDAGHGRMLGGEDKFQDTPVGLPLRWVLGTDSDITAKIAESEARSTGRGTRRRHVDSYRVELENRSSEPARVEIEQPNYGYLAQDFRIEREGMRSRIDPDRGIRVWSLELAAGAQRTFDVRWSYSDPE